jgi:hypothetical protein
MKYVFIKALVMILFKLKRFPKINDKYWSD